MPAAVPSVINCDYSKLSSALHGILVLYSFVFIESKREKRAGRLRFYYLTTSAVKRKKDSDLESLPNRKLEVRDLIIVIRINRISKDKLQRSNR